MYIYSMYVCHLKREHLPTGDEASTAMLMLTVFILFKCSLAAVVSYLFLYNDGTAKSKGACKA